MSLSHEPQKTSILIVEDSPTQAEQLKELLIQAGYEVTIATDGKVALSILETTIPDLVITDIVMPEMDGYALCKTIKQDERFKRIPVILVTSLYDLEDVVKGLESGANNFIIKPYHEKYLLSRIEIVLSNFHYEDTDADQIGIDITLAGKKIHITSSPLQILNILLSTYETATQKNQELIEAKKQLRIINENLEETVTERTSDLELSNRSLLHEIEIKNQTEIALQRKTRAYQMISECNQFFIRASNENDLLTGICNILIKSGGFRSAWVGIINNYNPTTVEPAAQAGYDEEFLQSLRINLERGLYKYGSTCTAIRTRKPVIMYNIPHQATNEGWIHDAIQEKGYSNVAALPLIIQDKIIGALTIYASEVESFDADETRLLTEMADDMAYGIQSLRIRDAEKWGENELKKSEIRYRRLFEAAKDGILILDENSGGIIDANPFVLNMLGYSHHSIQGKYLWEIGITQDKVWAEQAFITLKNEGFFRYEDLELITHDGKTRYVEFIGNIYQINGSNVIQCNIHDITQRKKMEDEIRSLNRDLEEKVNERTNQLTGLNKELQAENLERVHAENIIRETLSILNSAIETTVNGLLVVNTSRKITTYNKIFAEMWNIPDVILMSQDGEQVMDLIIRLVKNSEAFTGAVNELYATPDLEKFETIDLLDNRTIEWYSKPQRIEDTIVGRVWSFQDISLKKQLENKIERSLKEKEMLLKEIHHRVKNNMQVISGLLLLQSQNTKDETTQLLFKESQNRIRSISLVHEQLYRSDNFSQIEYGDYLRKMFQPLFESYKIDSRKVTMVIDVLPVMISIEKAVPCSLIVNELLSNSLKHAFPHEKTGEIKIGFVFNPTEESYTLDYRDNGIGFPEGFIPEQTGTLGMSLLFGLTRQLDGTITQIDDTGVHFIIIFPSRS